MSKCPNCGASMEAGVCAYCGTRDETVEYKETAKEIYKETINQQALPKEERQVNTNKEKNKWVLLFLVIFFGAFGLHNFYAGRVGRGILFFLTVGIFCVGWFSDIYAVCTNKYVDGNGMPITGK